MHKGGRDHTGGLGNENPEVGCLPALRAGQPRCAGARGVASRLRRRPIPVAEKMRTASLVTTRNVLLGSLTAEAITGATVALAPALLSRLLFGSAVAGAGATYGRLLGVTLIALVIACWPVAPEVPPAARRAVLPYNLLAAVYLAYLGIGTRAGVLLWPAVAEHALVTLLLAARTGDEDVSS